MENFLTGGLQWVVEFYSEGREGTDGFSVLVNHLIVERKMKQKSTVKTKYVFVAPQYVAHHWNDSKIKWMQYSFFMTYYEYNFFMFSRSN